MKRIIFIIIVAFIPLAVSATPLCKKIDGSWNWFSDHLISQITYDVAVEEGYSVRVATGMSVFGNPLGSRFDFSGKKSIKAYGIGAIHIKKTSGAGNPLVCVDQTEMKLIDVGKYLADHLDDYEHIRLD